MSRLRLVQNQFRCLVTRCKQSACKGGLLTYRFFVEREGDYSLTTALIPTHAVDAGGSHQLTIQALDDHVVVDQWKLSTSSQSYCHY